MYTPITKSGEGLTSCSCETDSPHPESAPIISGIDIDGNQYCPPIFDSRGTESRALGISKANKEFGCDDSEFLMKVQDALGTESRA